MISIYRYPNIIIRNVVWHCVISGVLVMSRILHSSLAVLDGNY